MSELPSMSVSCEECQSQSQSLTFLYLCVGATWGRLLLVSVLISQSNISLGMSIPVSPIHSKYLHSRVDNGHWPLGSTLVD